MANLPCQVARLEVDLNPGPNVALLGQTELRHLLIAVVEYTCWIVVGSGIVENEIDAAAIGKARIGAVGPVIVDAYLNFRNALFPAQLAIWVDAKGYDIIVVIIIGGHALTRLIVVGGVGVDGDSEEEIDLEGIPVNVTINATGYVQEGEFEIVSVTGDDGTQYVLDETDTWDIYNLTELFSNALATEANNMDRIRELAGLR